MYMTDNEVILKINDLFAKDIVKNSLSMRRSNAICRIVTLFARHMQLTHIGHSSN